MFEIPATGRYRMTRAPLAQALAQVRFPVRSRLQRLDGVGPVQDLLEADFPEMREQQIHEISLVVGPAGPAAAESGSSRSWEFRNEDGSSLILAPDSATLSAGREYEGVEPYSDRFQRVLSALAEAAGVRVCDRLGVRYLSLATTPPSDPEAWKAWFRPELLGWIGGDVLGGRSSLLTSISQTQISARPVGELTGPPVDVQAIIRHGFVPAGSTVPGVPPIALEHPAFLLDLDLFVAGGQRFDPEELSSQFRILHGQIDRFFRWSLTDAGEHHFGLEELA